MFTERSTQMYDDQPFFENFQVEVQPDEGGIHEDGPDAPDAARDAGRPRVRLLDFKLILRLAAVIFLFTQGNTSRSYGMVIGKQQQKTCGWTATHQTYGLCFPLFF